MSDYVDHLFTINAECVCADQEGVEEQERSPFIAQPHDESDGVGLSLICQPYDKTIIDSDVAERKLQQSGNCRPKSYV